ncbi:MAG: class I SAM-dependent methyltransferase [Roseococcus sp.]
MLEKTLELLQGIKKGQWVPEETECYDEREMQELAAALNKLLFAPSKLRRFLQEAGVTLTRSDIYSEIPRISEIEASFAEKRNLRLDSIFADRAFLAQFLVELTAFSKEFDPPQEASDPLTYSWSHGPFSYSDAMSYYAMVRRLQPRTVLELGCGTSTLVAQQAIARNGSGRHVAVEPFPKQFLRQMDGIELLETKAQDLTLEFFNDTLADGDILFIDTTHTVRHNSDCLHIYLRILPFIRHDITVHVHDIYLPNTLSLTMMRDLQLYWNEQYLLYAYLLRNPSIQVLFGSSYHRQENRDLLRRFMHGRHPEGGGSFWFRQNKFA